MERGRAKSRRRIKRIMILFCYLRLLGSLRAHNPPYPPPPSFLSLSPASVGTRLCENHFYYRHFVYQIWLVSCCLHWTDHCCFNWVSFQHHARGLWKGLVKSLVQNSLDLFMFLSKDPSLYILGNKGTKINTFVEKIQWFVSESFPATSCNYVCYNWTGIWKKAIQSKNITVVSL